MLEISILMFSKNEEKKREYFLALLSENVWMGLMKGVGLLIPVAKLRYININRSKHPTDPHCIFHTTLHKNQSFKIKKAMSQPLLYTTSRIFEDLVDLLGSSLESLELATKDIPRLKQVLDTQKVFGLVPELDLRNAQARLKNETHPQITYLIEKLQKEVARLQRKKMSLESDFNLRKVRLEMVGKGADSEKEAKYEKLRMLRTKRDRLKYSLSRQRLQNYRLIPLLPPPGWDS